MNQSRHNHSMSRVVFTRRNDGTHKKIAWTNKGATAKLHEEVGGLAGLTIDTHVVHFTVITNESSNLNLNANVLTHITSPIQWGPLQPSDLQFVQSISPEKLADVLSRYSCY